MPHDGFVIHSGETGDNNKQIIEYSLKLDSNPEFTASVLIALARATYRMNCNGQFGAKTILDIPFFQSTLLCRLSCSKDKNVRL